MALSRLRLRLASAFALTFAGALFVVALASLGWLWRESTRRLDRRLATLAGEVEEAVRREFDETPDSSFAFALEEVRRDWVWSGAAWTILDPAGRPLATTADEPRARHALAAWRATAARATGPATFTSDTDGDDLRGTVRPVAAQAGAPPYVVLAFGTTEGIERDTEVLAVALAIAAPLIVALALVGGYGIARRALRPVDALGAALEVIGPRDLGARLPVHAPPDEVDVLASRFNELLARLEAAQAQNRGFVREAAHQIRTPLTLVHGEADHALATPDRPAADLVAALTRIRTAAQQVRRRVDELFLLAEAEAGAVIDRRERVELDGLAVEAVDLFRARAAQMGRTLAYGEIGAAAVQGNESLLREAVLELLENACRHSPDGSEVTVSVEASGVGADLVVTSALAPRATGAGANGREPLGQRIVRWIAEGHGGTFTGGASDGRRYVARMALPVLTTSASA